MMSNYGCGILASIEKKSGNESGPWSKKKQREMKKKRWESFSPQARIIARSLKAADLLKMPERMRGWGLATFLLNTVAENIDKAIAETKEVGI